MWLRTRLSVVYKQDLKVLVMYEQDSWFEKVQPITSKAQEKLLILLTVQEQPQTEFTLDKQITHKQFHFTRISNMSNL